MGRLRRLLPTVIVPRRTLQPDCVRRILVPHRTNSPNLNLVPWKRISHLAKSHYSPTSGELLRFLRNLCCTRRLDESFHPMTGFGRGYIGAGK